MDRDRISSAVAFNRSDHFQIVFDLLDRRMKAHKVPFAVFDRQRRCAPFSGFAFSLVFAPSVLVSVSKAVSASPRLHRILLSTMLETPPADLFPPRRSAASQADNHPETGRV